MAQEKRAAEDPLEGNIQAKAPRYETNGTAKRKAAGSSRTGQACDRCKVRKIKCDARPGGCSPCAQNQSECRTTDRITGRATSRGHTENIENENTTLKVYVAELQQQLKENGVEPKPVPLVPQQYAPSPSPAYWGAAGQAGWDGQPAEAMGTLTGMNEERGGALLSDFRAGCIGDNYLGVSSSNSWLAIEGTALTLFGAKIDLAEFIPPDEDPEKSEMSYQSFLNYAFGSQKASKPALPPPELGKVYADWYFRSVQPFIPILHRPNFMQLLNRVYHENYETTPAETVMVHVVMGILNYQYAVRNQDPVARANSFSHYQYATSFIPDLIKGHTLQDIQGLALLCAQLRGFPRPAAAWMFTNMVLGLAIEMGLHRSVNAWQNKAGEKDLQTIETRKRVFWSVLTIHVTISGKLGRPMPLRLDDMDVEIPEPVHDNLPEEAHLPEWRKCSFRAAIYGFQLVRIVMQTYSAIYSIRSTTNTIYETNLRSLDKELRAFMASMPPELSGGPQTKDEDRVSALYLQLTARGCQLQLHHPALCRSSSPRIMNDNIDVCLEASNKMLAAATQLRVLKSLDSTFYFNMDLLAAVFTTLFAYTERRDMITSADVQRLRQEMDLWVQVMGDVGQLLGTGTSLQNAMRNFVEWSLGNINNHLVAKTASAAVASTQSPADSQPSQPQPQAQTHHQQTAYNTPEAYTNGYPNGSADHTTVSQQTQGSGTHTPVQSTDVRNIYQAAGPYPYPSQQSNSMGPYTTGAMTPYDQPTYATEDMKPNAEAQLAAQVVMAQQASQPNVQTMAPQIPAANNFLSAFQSPSTQHNTYNTQPMQQDMSASGGPVAWRNFADSMLNNMGMGVGEQHYMTSANALMALGGKDGSMGISAPGAAANLGSASFGGMQMPPETGASDWPLLQYNNGA